MTARRDHPVPYDVVIFDLDGVVYLGEEPVAHAPGSIAALRASGTAVAFATNNASRRAQQVADLLGSLGVQAAADEVVTAAQVAAAGLAEGLPAGTAVLVVGADALRAEVADVGLRPVARAGDEPAAVVQGYSPDVGWRELAEACVAVRGGARWVATNADRTLPSPRGELPGNGALVAALATALDRGPDTVVGKPAPTLFRRAAQGAGPRRALVVGDRLDTDIEGAVAAGMDSLLVLTGVATPADLLAAPPRRRPTYVAGDLRALAGGMGPALPTLAHTGTGGWSVRACAGGLELSGDGADLDALRGLAAAAWARPDTGGPVPVSAVGSAAGRALRAWDLSDSRS